MPRTIPTEPLTKEAFAPYGFVISGDRDDVVGKPANQGTAKRFDWLGEVENLRPDASRFNLCLFRCSPRKDWPLTVQILEKHPFTTQIIVPMNATEYVVLVGKRTPGDVPDLSTLRAFLATSRQGVAYLPATWHHPIIALDHETDFASVVFEDESKGDCTLVTIPEEQRPVVALQRIGPTPTH
jgi:ureidoglycolate lyase